MISFLILLLILFFYFRAKAANRKKFMSRQVNASEARREEGDYSEIVVPKKKPLNSNSSRALKKSFAEHNAVGVIRDERNDWLSRQIEEERRAQVRVSAMLGLKRGHEASCDARALKREHLKQHGKN